MYKIWIKNPSGSEELIIFLSTLVVTSSLISRGSLLYPLRWLIPLWWLFLIVVDLLHYTFLNNILVLMDHHVFVDLFVHILFHDDFLLFTWAT